jgi:hypothetical protein
MGEAGYPRDVPCRWRATPTGTAPGGGRRTVRSLRRTWERAGRGSRIAGRCSERNGIMHGHGTAGTFPYRCMSLQRLLQRLCLAFAAHEGRAESSTASVSGSEHTVSRGPVVPKAALGQALLEAGWRQGAVFDAPSVYFAWNENPASGKDEATTMKARKKRSKEKLVLVTQDCDIKASAEEESYVEALVCVVERRQDFLHRIDRNSARWFVVDPGSGLVAQAKYRVQIAKEALTTLTPEVWPSTATRLDRFVQWLARRYDRPAIPDPIVEAFQRPLAWIIHG